MKKFSNILLLLSAGAILAFSACNKDKDKDPVNNNNGGSYTCATCVKSPEAKAEYDGSSKGVYKGILIASTGTIRFNVGNDGSSISAVMVIDGTTVSLSSSITWDAGEPYVAPFTGMMGTDPVSITFSVDRDGTDPVIVSSSIPGHPNASFTLAKETSNALIEGFEGTYSTSDGKKGTFNILLSRAIKKWGGIARENGTTDEDDIDGTLDGSRIMQSDSGEIGTLTADEINGSFKDSHGATVTIKGKRTL